MNDRRENDSHKNPIAEVAKKVKLDAATEHSSKIPKGKKEKESTPEAQVAKRALFEGGIPPLETTYNSNMQGFGLLEHVPQELLDTIVSQFPTNSEEAAQHIESLKIFWKAPPGTSADQMIKGSIDVKKFAEWVDQNKIPLKYLNLSDADFKNLLPHLRHLDLSETNFHKPDLLRTCPVCKNIEHISLGGSNLLWSIQLLPQKFPGLKSIDLSETDGGTSEMSRLNRLEKFNSLSLRKCNLINADLEELAQLTKLNSLDLRENNELTNASLIHLENLPLHHLDLRDCTKLTQTGRMNLAAKLSNLDSDSHTRLVN